MSYIHNRIVQISIIIASVIACYSNSFRVPFIWDDEEMIVGNKLIQGKDLNAKAIFSEGAFGEKLDQALFYRPVTILSFSIDHKLFGGLKPVAFHFMNLLWHLIGCVFLFLLLERFSLPWIVPFAATLIYAVHPINIENVTYLSARGDLMSNAFCFLTLLIALIALRSRFFILWSLLMLFIFTVCVFTKENAILLPLVLTGLLFVKIPQLDFDKKKLIIVTAILWLVAIGYLIFRKMIITNSTVSMSLIANASFAERLYTLPTVIVTYLRLLILPFNYHMEYHFVNHSIFNYGILFLTAVCLFLWWTTSSLKLNKQLLFLWLIWFFAFFIPIANILVVLPSTIREHWISLSSVAVIVLLVLVVYSYPKLSEKTKILLFVGVVLYFMGYTIRRNNDWKDEMTLYSHDVKLEPKSFILWNNLGVAYIRNDNVEKAYDAFTKSVEVCPKPGYSPSYNNLGVAEMRKGQYENAYYHYLKSIELDNYYRAYDNIGSMLINLQKDSLAIPVLKKGTTIYPEDAKLLYMLAFATYNTGNVQEAFTLFQRIPDYADTKQIIEKIAVQLSKK
jgi:tetratricopeptide (TPR) repeat protein